jgi:hypothetical protein
MQIQFLRKFTRHQAPTRSVSNHLIQKFELTAGVCDNKKGVVGRHRSACVDRVACVCKALLQSLSNSVTLCSQSLSIKRTSTHSIMKQDLTLYPYKIKVVLLFTAANIWRHEFYQDLLQFMQLYSATLDCMWFNDKAHFHLSGFMNKQNIRF